MKALVNKKRDTKSRFLKFTDSYKLTAQKLVEFRFTPPNLQLKP